MGTEDNRVEIVEIDPDYDQFIKNLVKEESTLTVPNSSESHALSILRAIFANSTSSIYLFSDQLSRRVYNDPQLLSSVTEFLRNKKKLNILVRNQIDGSGDEQNLFLNTIKDDPSASVKRIGADNLLSNDNDGKPFSNFVVSDKKMFRLEVDPVKANAYCSFNNPDIAQKLSSIFENSFTDKASAI